MSRVGGGRELVHDPQRPRLDIKWPVSVAARTPQHKKQKQQKNELFSRLNRCVQQQRDGYGLVDFVRPEGRMTWIHMYHVLLSPSNTWDFVFSLHFRFRRHRPVPKWSRSAPRPPPHRRPAPLQLPPHQPTCPRPATTTTTTTTARRVCCCSNSVEDANRTTTTFRRSKCCASTTTSWPK